MQTFAYQQPASVADALKAASAPGARYLAGGQSLLPAMKLGLSAPEALVDLGAIAELRNIAAGQGMVTIGAMATHASVAESQAVRGAIPALAALAENIGDRQVRNRGTLGGSLANNDPAADYPAAVLGLNATIRTDRRSIATDEFFTGMFSTALSDGEIITEVSFPIPKKASYKKFPNPASRYAMAGVFVAQTNSGVRVAVTGAGPCVFRVPAMETALAKSFSTNAIEGIAIDANGLNSDIHGSAEYRAHLVSVMARRAVAEAA